MVKRNKISLGVMEGQLGDNPFAALPKTGLQVNPNDTPSTPLPASKRGSRQRQVRMRREKTGRGGKEVTVLWDFAGLPERDLEPMLHTIKKRCGTGGRMCGVTMEIQGDQR